MISKLSQKITDALFLKSSVNQEERELYIYGIFIFISHLMYLVLAFIFGCLFKLVGESIAFYISFQAIRRNAGGYHASTETRCEILSTLSIFTSIFIIKLSYLYDFQIIILSITLISILIIFFLCPLDTPVKPLSKKEQIYFRKKSRIVLLILSLLIVFSLLCEIKILFFPCCVSIILESILLLCGKIKSLASLNQNKDNS